jgi:hypothetical protein
VTIQESFNLAIRLHQDGQPAEAEKIYRQILSQQPDHAQAYCHLGNALKALGRADEAIRAYRQAMAIDPEYAEACNNLGNTLRLSGFVPEALEALRQAATLRPDDAVIQFNFGNALLDADQLDQSLAAFQRAAELKPDFAGAHFNIGVLLLLRGDYAAGWPEFEWRWQTPKLLPIMVRGPQPQWEGEELDGKRILIHADQSLGDTLNFIRYVPMVHERGGKIILACHDELHRLFAQICPIEQWVASGQPLPDYDVRTPMMSLARIFGTTLNNLPNKVPYLSADPDLSRRWRRRIPHDHRLKVGLVWSGTPNPPGRSIPVQALAPLARLPDVCFYSLQKFGHRMAGVKRDQPPLTMVDWTNDIHDFADTAALIDNLDLVITIDTAVAHLAGAMGKKTWILVKTFPDWRWLLDRTDSPWYPTARLFRQKRAGDWTEPVAEIVSALTAGEGRSK